MITLINHFTVTGELEEFERVFKLSSEFMSEQDGFISHQLHQSLADPNHYVNIAHWERPEDHVAVIRSGPFAEHVQALAAVAKSSPGLYEPIGEEVLPV